MVTTAAIRSANEQAGHARRDAQDAAVFAAAAVEDARAHMAHEGAIRSAHEALALLWEALEGYKAEVFRRGGARDPWRVRSELVQVAAAAIRAAVELHVVHVAPPPAVGTGAVLVGAGEGAARVYPVRLNLPDRVAYALERAGYVTLDQLVGVPRAELLRIRRISALSADQIAAAIARIPTTTV